MADINFDDLQNASDDLKSAFERLYEASSKQSEASKNVFKDMTIEDSLRRQHNKTIKDSVQQQQSRKAIEDKAISTAKSLSDGMFSVTQSVYTSSEAFTAVVPVIDTMTTVVKNVVDALGLMGSGVGVLGTSAGRISEGVAKAVNTGIDLVSAAVTQQLKNTQTLVNNLNTLSSAGVTFGGSLSRMQAAAAEGGISIDTYTKIVSKNADSLARIGGSVELGAQRVVTMSRALAKNNDQLLAMYGGFEKLNEGVADFISIQTGYGLTGVRTNKDLEKSAKDYLYRQKELSDLTGQSVDALKKREQERQTVLAYQNAQAKMTADEQANAQVALEMARRRGGEKLERLVMEEIIARKTGMKVYSQETMLLQAYQPELARTFTGITDNLDQSQTAFKQATVNQIRASADEVDARNRNSMSTTLSQLAFTKHLDGASAELAGVINSVGSASVTSSEWAKGLTEANMLQKKNNELGAKDPSTAIIAGAVRSLEEFKTEMDTNTIKYLGETGKYLRFAYTGAELLAKGLNKTNTVISFMLKGMEGKVSTEDWKQLANELGVEIPGIGGGGTASGGATKGSALGNDQDLRSSQAYKDWLTSKGVEGTPGLYHPEFGVDAYKKAIGQKTASPVTPTAATTTSDVDAEVAKVKTEFEKKQRADEEVKKKQLDAAELDMKQKREAIAKYALENPQTATEDDHFVVVEDHLATLIDITKDNRDYLEKLFHASV